MPPPEATLAALWPLDRDALSRFDHTSHIRVAREYISTLPLPVAIGAFARDLEAMTIRFGAHAKFHRTITLAWLLLVADRVLRAVPNQTWDEFASANPDLLSRRLDPVRELFDPGALDAEDSRRSYCLPTVLRVNTPGQLVGAARG